MRRVVPAAVALLGAAALTSGCGYFEQGELGTVSEVHFEVTGGTAEKITYSVTQPEAPGGKSQEEVPNPTLPWKQATIGYPGEATLTVVLKEGAGTCRIVVEKKQAAKRQGQPGAPLTCTAKLKDPS